ncbi:MAG TPA: vWA domain-containing protein [Polyangiaceae bacterium]|jgi:hypothetical protein|nr:vWA domain-containing protein [Polyangiaceae bacterium]
MLIHDRRVAWLSLIGVLGVTASGCSSSSGSATGAPLPGAGSSSAVSGGGASGSVGLGGNGNVSPSGNGGTSGGLFNTSGGSTGVQADGSCAETSSTGEKITTTQTTQVPAPVAVYLMQDQSLSMLGAKWTSVQQAIQAFTTDPNSAGIDVAIKFFADANVNLLDCTGTGYDTPDAPMGPLPQNATAINNSVTAHGPSSVTPIEPALRGATNFCLNYQANSTTGEKCVAVLITDGQPDFCDGNVTDLAQIAADALAKGVKTFTVGMDGADFNMLDSIAQAGGTDCTPMTMGAADQACDVRAGTQAFVAALNTIRGTVTTTTTVVKTTQLNCQYQIPPVPAGQNFNRDQVNVRLTVNGVQHDYLRVDSASACAGVGNEGWYYDNPTNPAEILVCSDTCDDIKAATGDGGTTTASNAPDARVDILLGCATKLAIN